MHPRVGFIVVRFLCLFCPASLSIGGSGDAATFTDPGQALAALQSQVGGTFLLNFDATLKLSTTIKIAADTTIDGTGHSITFDGDDQVRHFAVSSSAKLRLVGLTLANGRANSPSTDQPSGFETAVCGGSILNVGGALEVIDCVFTANAAIGLAGGGPPPTDSGGLEPGARGSAAYGGAICSFGGLLSVTNSVFDSNTAAGGPGGISAGGYTGGGGDASGGALFSKDEAATYQGVAFTNNQAQAGDISSGRALEGGGGAYGGALADESAVSSVIRCQFTGNRAIGATKVGSDTSRETGVAEGGGLYHGDGNLSIAGTTIQGNSSAGGIGAERGGGELVFADGRGGGIYNTGTLQMGESTLFSNVAKGGDIPADCCSPLIAQAGTGAGGALANSGRSGLVNCTVVSNSAAGGQATMVGAFTGPAYGGAVSVATGSVTLVNVTLAANQLQVLNVHKAFGSTAAIAGGALTLTNTILACDPAQTNVWGLVIDGGHNLASDSSPQFSRPTSQSGLDPLLGPLQPNGGFAWSMLPLPASPAIDAGDDAVSSPADQRGVSRPQGLSSDIGAVEVLPQLQITSGTAGQLQLSYTFRAGLTNQVSVSTNLLDWEPFGTAVSDQTGKAVLGLNARDGQPVGFYKVQPAPR